MALFQRFPISHQFMGLAMVATLSAYPFTASYASMASNPFAEPGMDGDEAIFADAEVLSDDMLEEQRGGFFTAGGMIIDIGLFTQTLVDGVIVDQADFNAAELETIDPSELQKLIQVSKNNVSVQNLGLEDVPQLLTVIQNSGNNRIIENFTILNIDVGNTSAFNLQNSLSSINSGLVNSL